jgi:hypothetical protein
LGWRVEDCWLPTSRRSSKSDNVSNDLPHPSSWQSNKLNFIHLSLCPLFYFCRERTYTHLTAVATN